jgi:hypothetical protein
VRLTQSPQPRGQQTEQPKRSQTERGGFGNELNISEQTIVALIKADVKIERIRIGRTVAERDGPQSGVGQRVSVLIREDPYEGSGGWIKGINFAVAKIANQQIASEPTEPSRGESDSPGRVEGAVGDQTLHQDSTRAVDVDVAAASRKGHGHPGCDFPIFDVKKPAEVLDIKRRVTGREHGIDETAGQEHLSIAGIVNVDAAAGSEIRGIQEVVGQRKTFILRTGFAGYLGGSASTVPSIDAASERIEDEGCGIAI